MLPVDLVYNKASGLEVETVDGEDGGMKNSSVVVPVDTAAIHKGTAFTGTLSGLERKAVGSKRARSDEEDEGREKRADKRPKESTTVNSGEEVGNDLPSPNEALVPGSTEVARPQARSPKLSSMECPTFDMRGIEKIAERAEGMMRRGLTPSRVEVRDALTALRTLLTERAQLKSRAQKKKKEQVEDAKSKRWQIKLEELVCDGHPILEGVEYDEGLAEFVKRNDFHNRRAAMIEQRFKGTSSTVVRSSAARDYVSDLLRGQDFETTSGADKKEISVANTEVEDAKIHAKYGLNTQDITKFAQDVLSDYLFAASANRGLLRTLIRNVPSLKANKETIQKLAYMFPQQPSAFYEGRQRVFVAKPLFIYPAYSESLLTRKEMNAIVSFAEGYPANMGRDDSIPRALKSLTAFQRISPLQDLRTFLTLGARARDSSRWLEHRYTTQGHLSAVLSTLTADPRQELSHRGFRPLCYYSDLGGFYPSPPPRWPRRLMYAIMDGFLENLPHIINMDDPTNSNLTPVQMAYFQKPASLTDKIEVEKIGGGTATITVKQAKDIAELRAGYSEPLSAEQITQFILNPIVKKLYKNADLKKTEDKPSIENIDIITGNIEKAIENKDQGLSPTATSELTFDAAGPKSLLEMTYDIAEIATAKYDYNMRGDDFKFVMAVVTYSFRALTEATQGSAFELTRNRIEAGIEDIMGTNRFNRLERLRQSIAQNEFDERPRAGYIQSTLLAQLMVIDGEMTNRMNAVMTEETRERTRTELREEYNRITEALEEAPRSPSFTSAVQRILLNMNRTIQGD